MSASPHPVHQPPSTPLSQWTQAALAALWAAPLLPALWRKYALEHDSVNFALAATEFNLHSHQPHPAGFPYWVGLIHVLGLTGAGPLLAQTLLALAFTAAAALLYRKYDAGRNPGSEFLLLLSPVAWFYAAVPATYSVDLAFSCLVLLLARKAWAGDRSQALLLAAAIGIWSGFRSSSSAFMLPLLLACAWRARTMVRSGALFAALWLVWYMPVVWSAGGLQAFGRIMSEMTVPAFAQTSILYGAPLSAHALALIGSAIFICLMLAPAALASVVSRERQPDRTCAMGSGWMLPVLFAGPALLFMTLIHAPKPGYYLILLPPVLAVLMARVRLTRRGVAAAAAVSMLLSFFPYEWALSAANGYNFTRATLRSLFLIESAHRAIAALPPEGRISVLNNRSEAPNLRTLRYHFPAVQWTSAPGACVVLTNAWEKAGGRMVSGNAMYSLWRRDCAEPSRPVLK